MNLFGPFGNVLGIMTSLIGFSKSQATDLAVVVPGIAEAPRAVVCESMRIVSRQHDRSRAEKFFHLIRGAAE